MGEERPSQPQGSSSFRDVLRTIGSERTGIAALITILIIALPLSQVAWGLLAEPAARLAGLFPNLGQCTDPNLTAGTWPMYKCSAKVGLVTIAGPFLLVALLYPLRRVFSSAIGNLDGGGPSKFLIAPLVATLIFALFWAGLHKDTRDMVGLVKQVRFPAVIGAFTFLVSRWNGAIQREFTGFFRVRNVIPVAIRAFLALLLPLALAVYLHRKPDAAGDPVVKQQVVVLLTLVLGYLAFAPWRQSSRAVQTTAPIPVEVP